ncbi:MAG: arginine deiminase, partial [Trebonia sp.]
MPFGAHSEVGKLRRVMVHRPGLEHARLTPSNAEELLFDDVLWVARAKAEHDMFCEVMRERGVEVFEAETLLAEALARAEARDWVCGHILNEREVGIRAAQRAREWVAAADPALVAEFLIGGITKADVQRDVGLVWESADPASMLLPPLPNFLFQRDPSCWIFGGVTINPMTKPARKPETMIMETIYRFSPLFAAEKFPVWLGGTEEDWGRCHVEGGDVQPIGNGTVMIGMGERTTPQAVLWIARSLFRAGSARQVLAVHLPKSRSYMHLDTVITMCDRDLVTLFPQVVYGARTWAIRPGTSAEDLRVEEQRGSLPEVMGVALGVGKMRVIETGGDTFEAEREQWDDGNNVVALEPGVVVAY